MPIPTKLCTVIKTNDYASWEVQADVQQIQDNGRPPPWKSKKATSPQWFNELAQNLAWYHVLALQTQPAIKILDF